MDWCGFFFKQKTAYEMRISDWSSDVCSSDLIRTNMGGNASSGDTELHHAALFVTVAPWSPVAGRELGFQARRDHYDVGIMRRLPLAELAHPARLAARIAPTLRPAPEIGRASCRERVCQYV